MDPGIDGLETYKKILEMQRRQKAVIASGFSETDRVKQTQDLGARLYIQKPYTLEKKGITIQDALSNSRRSSSSGQYRAFDLTGKNVASILGMHRMVFV